MWDTAALATLCRRLVHLIDQASVPLWARAWTECKISKLPGVDLRPAEPSLGRTEAQTQRNLKYNGFLRDDDLRCVQVDVEPHTQNR